MTSFSTRMLEWYDRNARDLPWRVAPADSIAGVRANPYHVWLSEVMLQQTTVAAVKSYFATFVSKWPDVFAMSRASEDDIMSAWAGLGYYSRARNLKKCADLIVSEHGGQFPQTRSELIKLPGIGDYTASAIAAIGFGEAAPVVDGNIERVFARHGANSCSGPSLKQAAREFMQLTTPVERPGDFAQSLMDLGATICTPRNPACALCPVSGDCVSRTAGTVLDYPVKVAKKPKPLRRGAAFVARRNNGAVWLVRRPPKGLLGGMASFPTTEWSVSKDGDTGSQAAPCPAEWHHAGTVRHTFTHFHLELEVWTALAKPEGEGWWSAGTEMDGAGLPTLMRNAWMLCSQN